MATDRRKAWQRVGHLLSRQHHLITRRQALAAGLTDADVRRELKHGRWQRGDDGLYRGPGFRRGPEATLLAACLITGGRASHEWAAWLWGLGALPKTAPSVSVAGGCRNQYRAIAVHRQAHPRFGRPPLHRCVPCTDPVTTLIDLGAVVTADDLDRAIDTALARRLVTIEALLTELERLRPYRQAGAGAVRASLKRRGYLGAPQPSVLESRVLRLLSSAGIRPLHTEAPVWVGDHRYRLDFVLAEGLALEVDGYTYHAHPAAMRADARRRNQIANATGMRILVYTWQDIVEEGERVLDEVRRALADLVA